LITSHQRGHTIEYNGTQWVYSDDKTSVNIERSCLRCGNMPTTEGYDYCMGHVPNAISVCCGHGVSESIKIQEVNHG